MTSSPPQAIIRAISPIKHSLLLGLARNDVCVTVPLELTSCTDISTERALSQISSKILMIIRGRSIIVTIKNNGALTIARSNMRHIEIFPSNLSECNVSIPDDTS